MRTWDSLPLGDLCVLSGGGTPSRARPEFFGGEIPWVKIGDMLQGNVTATEETLAAIGLKHSAAKILPVGTVLVSIFATIGRTAVLGVPAATNQAIAGVTPRDSHVLSPRYLRRFLEYAARSLAERSRGVAQANINFSILRSLPVPLPPMVLQLEIARTLDCADALRARRRATLALIDSLTGAIFVEMFGTADTPRSRWPTSALKDLIVDGPQNGLYRPSSDYGRGVPILRIDGFYDGAVVDVNALKRVDISTSERRRFELAEGDIVINRVNSIEYLGKCALIPKLLEPTVFESNMMRLRVDTSVIHPRFVVQALQTPELRSQILGRAKRAVNQASINQQDVGSFRVPLPPLALQGEFVARVAAVEALSGTAKRSAVALDSLFASLQHQAFNGELV